MEVLQNIDAVSDSGVCKLFDFAVTCKLTINNDITILLTLTSGFGEPSPTEKMVTLYSNLGILGIFWTDGRAYCRQ